MAEDDEVIILTSDEEEEEEEEEEEYDDDDEDDDDTDDDGGDAEDDVEEKIELDEDECDFQDELDLMLSYQGEGSEEQSDGDINKEFVLECEAQDDVWAGQVLLQHTSPQLHYDSTELLHPSDTDQASGTSLPLPCVSDIDHKDNGNGDVHVENSDGNIGQRDNGEGHENNGNKDIGREDNGDEDIGHEDNGNEDIGHKDIGHEDSGNKDIGHKDDCKKCEEIMYYSQFGVDNERIHQLERERRDLLGQLATYKEDAMYGGHTHPTSTETISDTQPTVHDSNIELQSQNNSLLSENKQLHLKLNSLQHLERCENRAVIKVEESYKSIVASLRERLKELEDSEKKCRKLERRVRELEREKRDVDESRRMLAVSVKQLEEYEQLRDKNHSLTIENNALRERVGNEELLTYQLQKMREKCLILESKQTEMDRLVVENQELTDKLGKLVGDANIEGLQSPMSSLVTQHYRIVQLQQNEVILVHKCGELETQLKLAQKLLDNGKREIEELKLKLSLEKEESVRQQDVIRRLERRVQFIAKEREGCVKVLNSYKVDGNVDTLVREMNNELQESLSRASIKITELESTIEDAHTSSDKEKKRADTAELKVAALSNQIKILEEANNTLQLERQSLEELIAKRSTISI